MAEWAAATAPGGYPFAEVVLPESLCEFGVYPLVTWDMDNGERFVAPFVCVAEGCWELRTPEIAFRVLGVIVAATLDKLVLPELPIMARKAAVPGLGGGKETGPPMRGVRPVPGVRPVRGVRPVLKALVSKVVVPVRG